MAFIEIEVNEKSYKLEYTRDALCRIEANGFAFAKVEDQIVTSLRLLFWGSLLKHQPRLSVNQADKLMDEVLKEYEMDSLMEALITLANDAFPSSDSTKKKLKKLTIIK